MKLRTIVKLISGEDPISGAVMEYNESGYKKLLDSAKAAIKNEHGVLTLLNDDGDVVLVSVVDISSVTFEKA